MHSPSQPAVLERAGLKNIAVRNSVATCSQAQGKDGGRVGRGRSRARGQRGAPAMDPVLGSIPVTSWKARGIPHMGLQGLEQGFACCTRPLPAQHSKKHTTTTKKKVPGTTRKPLVISRQFRSPGSLLMFLLIAVTDYLEGMKGSQHETMCTG